ncbi:methyltransferase domain-containing protein [Streptomyces zagrosensis]|uniref:Ubiquinone/menaquinone biosynthesis C-methylase UbiE n=1 Tax=Streptomyces zagrosensis TaxID=1042984 RepID=A0A7W9Q5M3_9ACTN|nr:class I SAM-dependent methyltransferase [Streptomyces zagrosensis]MBB5933970.1 ubiquinone/menaquinone biosynthesis C-methylase UbiE [Streptomyces zagrosensis]
MAIIPTIEDVVAGQKSYTPFTLSFYDLTVYGVTCPLLWKVSRHELLKLYNRNISAEHLDIGVGSGYLLSKCTMPSANQRITLLDMNPHCLSHVSRRLSRYRISTAQGNVLEPFPLPERSHGSAALNLMLHCVPGDFAHKGVAFDHAAACVRPGGKIFGSTVLSQGVPVTKAARLALDRLNAGRDFNNRHDNLHDLRHELSARFSTFTLTVHGCTALFEATVE